MIRKAIVTFAWVRIASLALAQTTTKRTVHYRTTTAITSVEGVMVTAPIIASEERALPVTSLLEPWSFARTVRIQSGLIYQVPGLSKISLDDR